MKCRISHPILLAVAAILLATVPTVHAAGPRPCLKEVKRDAKDCAADCKETFQTAKDACLNRDHDCVEVCRADRSQCRLDSGFDAAITGCNDLLEAARAQCRTDNPAGDARDACIDSAQVHAFECRDSARELARPLLKQCRKTFRSCAKACPAPAASAPVDAKLCTRQANDDAKTCAATCKEDSQVGKDDCRNRDHACMEDCRATRTTCRQPVNAILNSDLADCATERQTGVDGCTTSFPPPRDPAATIDFDQCVDGVQVDAFVCRDDAHEHSHPGFATCKQNFRTCVDTNCPVQPN